MEARKGHSEQRADDDLTENYNSVLPVFLPVLALPVTQHTVEPQRVVWQPLSDMHLHSAQDSQAEST